MKKPRILLGLQEVAGYYAGLARGFSELGIPCDFIDLKGHIFGYGRSVSGPAVRMIRRLDRRIREKKWRTKLEKKLTWKIYKGLKTWLLIKALWKYDVFIFGSLSSFLDHSELPLLRRLGKKVIYVFHGSDSRPDYAGAPFAPTPPASDIRKMIKKTRRKKKLIRRIEQFAYALVNMPGTGLFHSQPFVSYLHLGVPLDIDPSLQALPRNPEAPVRILHCPSTPALKGSDRIRETIHSLKQQGYNLDYRELTGRPHAEVLGELTLCDFVVDQVFSDIPLPHFGAEAAWFGKPAVIGGYYSQEIKRDFNAEDIPPSLFCHPDSLEESVRRLVEDRDFRLDLGKRARDFVRSRWTPRLVAERYIRLLNGEIPPSWYFQPEKLSYIHGACLPENRIREAVEKYVRTGGTAALQLDDKPDLKQKYLALAGRQNNQSTSTSS